MPPTPRRTDELDAVVALVVAEQARPERRCTYVGTDAGGIRAELDALAPPWSDTVRVVTDGGRLLGASVVEWDEALGRSWILGPWVAGDATAWDQHAPALLDAALSQLPPTVTRHEVSGDVANELLGELALERGWTATEVNHALVADPATIAAWPDEPSDVALRDAREGDVTAIAALHDREFPGTYASADQLVAGHLDGSRIVLVVPAPTDGPGGLDLVGYAAGRVQADGDGFIDFVAVDPEARGRGIGHRLVTALTRELAAAAPNDRVALTVQAHRAAARHLYESLGFRADGAVVAYRSWTDGRR